MKTKLREVEPRDVGNLWRWRYESADWFFGELGSYEGHCKFWARELEDKYQHNFIIQDERGNDIGSISLFIRPGGAEYGRFLIKRDTRGKGYGKSALYDIMAYTFNHLHIPFLWGRVFAHNIVAQKVCIDLGFRFGPYLPRYVEKDGEWLDIFIMEMRWFEFSERISI